MEQSLTADARSKGQGNASPQYPIIEQPDNYNHASRRFGDTAAPCTSDGSSATNSIAAKWEQKRAQRRGSQLKQCRAEWPRNERDEAKEECRQSKPGSRTGGHTRQTKSRQPSG